MPSDAVRLNTRRGHWEIFAALFLAPLTAAANFEVNYLAVPFACESGWWAVLHASPVVTLAVAAYGASLGWRIWQASGAEWPNEEHGVMARSRFVGLVGFVFSLTGIALILMQWIPIWIMSPCVE